MARVSVDVGVGPADRVEVARALHLHALVHLRPALLHVNLLHYLPVAHSGI